MSQLNKKFTCNKDGLVDSVKTVIYQMSQVKEQFFYYLLVQRKIQANLSKISDSQFHPKE